jgi:phosphatidylserine/phosphatidylglycerophosphate/cardiolipin synthase-like enzyme
MVPGSGAAEGHEPGARLETTRGPIARAVTPIIQVGRNAWRRVHADDTGVLVDAADYYHAVYRAISRAHSHVLMSGWQFDSGVPLLRGADVPSGADVRFLKFLDGLCRRRPELRVYLLAWDFHLVFAGEREWLQRVIFHWMTSPNLRFRFADHPAANGSHHQKFVVIDGGLAFLGGMDICESRWDDRRHLADNPLRLSRGRPQKPYHDVQAWLAGRETARALEDLFSERWRRAGGPPLELGSTARPEVPARGSLPIGGTTVALSRTDPQPDGNTVREVERLFEDAIAAADRLIYVETQYLSSRRMREALAQRMRASGRPRPEIVIVVNEHAEALKEELAVGLRQARNLEVLRDVASRTGCALGCYFSLADGVHETFRATYIHSKLMIVDDRFLTVGSANLTNRSMGLDSELHVAWEHEGDDGPLIDSIRNVRVSLLAEHAGLSAAAATGLQAIDGLVARLDAIADRGGARLRRHGPPTPAQQTAMQLVDPDDLPFDPETTAADDAAGALDPSDEHSGRRVLPILAATAGGAGAALLAGLLARYITRARR